MNLITNLVGRRTIEGSKIVAVWVDRGDLHFLAENPDGHCYNGSGYGLLLKEEDNGKEKEEGS